MEKKLKNVEEMIQDIDTWILEKETAQTWSELDAA